MRTVLYPLSCSERCSSPCGFPLTDHGPQEHNALHPSKPWREGVGQRQGKGGSVIAGPYSGTSPGLRPGTCAGDCRACVYPTIPRITPQSPGTASTTTIVSRSLVRAAGVPGVANFGPDQPYFVTFSRIVPENHSSNWLLCRHF